MLNLRQIMTISSIHLKPSEIHRWNIFNGEKYLDCQERIKKCHSINFEDYSPDKNYLVKNKLTLEKTKTKDKKSQTLNELYGDDDIGLYMLTIG